MKKLRYIAQDLRNDLAAFLASKTCNHAEGVCWCGPKMAVNQFDQWAKRHPDPALNATQDAAQEGAAASTREASI